MFTFIISALGGAVIGGSYVLIRTPRTGKENQRFVKEFIQTTQENVEDVSNQAINLQQSISNLTNEIHNVQTNFVPEVIDIANQFKKETAVSTRRINDEILEINRELEALNN